MADERAKRGVGPILSAWMADVAPERAPERLFEEAFARTMAIPQLRAWPWHLRQRAGSAADHRVRGLALAGLAVVVVIAIGTGLVARPRDNAGGGPTPIPLPSPSISTGSPSPSVVPFPSAVVVEPTATIPVTGAVTLATDGTSIWLFTTAGELKRIDPVANAVAASVTLNPATDAYQSLAGDRAGLWVTDWDTGKVLRFDPQTLRATASIDLTSIDLGSKPKGVLITTAAIWVANTRGGNVVRIDPKTNKVVATVSTGPTGPSGPNWLAEGSGSIWVGVPNVGSVIRINETTNAVEATIKIVSPASPCGGLAAASTAIWITSCDGGPLVTQIDPVTNTIAATIDLGGRGYTFAMVADRPWVSPTGGQIVRLDPVGHAVDRVIAPGAGFLGGGGDVVVAAGSLWVIDGVSNRVLRLPIAAFGG
jgi:YVTN family beta-propeller protein